MAAVSQALETKRDKPCRFFVRGGCKLGDACGYRHDATDRAKPKHADPSVAPLAADAAAKKAPLRPRGPNSAPPAKPLSTSAVAAAPVAPAAEKAEKKERRGGRKARNTESFTPDHSPPAMRIVVDMATDKLSVPLQVRDVTLHPNLFNRPGDATLYQRLVSEIEHCGVPEERLFKSWHGDSHWIADDSTGWKKKCPTFLEVIARIQHYFSMDIKATRFNWYKDTSEWKPFHHDAAAVKPDKAKTQNFTVAVSFGATRDAAFEEVGSKTVLALPCPDRSVYCFARDVNIMWKHGILQVPPAQQTADGRISVIAWGWIDLAEVGPRPRPVNDTSGYK